MKPNGQKYPKDETESLVRILLEHGADPNEKDRETGNAPLHVCKRAALAKLLLKHGADPAANNREGRTPLHVCKVRQIPV